MNKNILTMVGLSLLLLLGSAPGVLLAHENHDHGERRGGYGEWEGSRGYDPPYEGNRWEDEYEEDEEDDTYRPSSRRYPLPKREPYSPYGESNRPQ